MAINPQIKIKVQTTWVKPVALFVCRHIKTPLRCSFLEEKVRKGPFKIREGNA